MLNEEWRNLSDNAWEFNLRNSWSSDVNNTIVPLKLLLAFVILCLGLAQAHSFYINDQTMLGIALAIGTLLIVPYAGLLFDLGLFLIHLAIPLVFLAFVLFCFYQVMSVFITVNHIHKQTISENGKR